MKIEVERRKIKVLIGNAGGAGINELIEGTGYCFQWKGHELASVAIVPSQGTGIWSSIILLKTGGLIFDPMEMDPAAMLFNFLDLSPQSHAYLLGEIIEPALKGEGGIHGFDVNKVASSKTEHLRRN